MLETTATIIEGKKELRAGKIDPVIVAKILNDNKLLLNKIGRLEEELEKSRARYNTLYGYWEKSGEMVTQLQKALADRLYPERKSRGCLSVVFRSNGN